MPEPQPAINLPQTRHAIFLVYAVKAGPTPSIALECRNEGADLIVPNVALLAWLQSQAGQEVGELEGDETGEKPWDEISQIVARVAKMLTIPASPEAYGMRAREFKDLDVRRVLDPKTGVLRLALVRRASTQIRYVRRKNKDGTATLNAKPVREVGGEVMFWLVRKVVQKADPTVLPYAEQMSARALAAIQARFLRLQQKQAGNGQEDLS